MARIRPQQPGHRAQRQALARARRPEQHHALRIGAQPHIHLEAAPLGLQRLAQGNVDHAIPLRRGNSRLASRSAATQVTDVMITSRLAVLSSPACTAS